MEGVIVLLFEMATLATFDVRPGFKLHPNIEEISRVQASAVN